MTAALITGASTGIGRELARLFAADGVDVVVVSSERSVAELDTLAEELRSGHGVRVDTITMDLAKPGAGADLVGRVDELGVDVDYLVNNAGVGILGLTVQDSDPDAVSRMVQLNVVTTTDLTLLYAGRMVKNGQRCDPQCRLDRGLRHPARVGGGLRRQQGVRQELLRVCGRRSAWHRRDVYPSGAWAHPYPVHGHRRIGRYLAAGQVLHGCRGGGEGGLRRDAGRTRQCDTRGRHEDHARDVGAVAVTSLDRRVLGSFCQEALSQSNVVARPTPSHAASSACASLSALEIESTASLPSASRNGGSGESRACRIAAAAFAGSPGWVPSSSAMPLRTGPISSS